MSDVLIDARRAAWNPTTGVGLYAQGLLEALQHVDTSLTVSVLGHSRVLPRLLSADRNLVRRSGGWSQKLVSDFLEVPLRALDARLCHLLYTEGASLGPTVVTVHDLEVLQRRPGSARTARYYAWRTAALLKRAARVICDSERTASGVRGQGREVGVRVVHPGVDLPERLARRRLVTGGGDSGNVVYSGGFTHRKNVSALLEAWCLLGPPAGRELLMTGTPPGWLGPLPPRVRSVGTLSRGQLWDLVDGAAAVVYPSINEGFGFPVLEGAMLGRPVVCGNEGIVPELPPGLVCTVDVSDPPAIARGLETVLAGDWRPEARAVRDARGRFTWSRCAQETCRVYEECV